MSSVNRTDSDGVEQAAEVFLHHPGAADRAHEVQPELLQGMRTLWNSMGTLGDSPEIRVMREQALAHARRSSVRRWSMPLDMRVRGWRRAAMVAGAALVLGAAWQISPYGYRHGIYETRIGEQRMLELDDQSRLVLDAGTRVRVDFSDDARVVHLVSGQAQFVVAHDPTRPFKVKVNGRTFVALGTAFTVDYAGDAVNLAMLEGRVALADSPLEVTMGQGIRVTPGAGPVLREQVDLEAAMAWRQGKVVFHDEPLESAIQRLNRYTELQLRIADRDLTAHKVSGVFDAGDTRGFLEMVRQYLPIRADTVRQNLIQLHKVR